MKKSVKGRIFVISGPSGSGKTTLAEKLTAGADFRRKFVKSVSFTTRPKRSGEKHGRDYFFISRQEFKKALQAKKILEWTRYLEYYYGTPKEFVDRQLESGKHMVMCLDLRGAKRIKRIYPRNSVTIFVEPPSLETLKERIAGRCSKTADAEIQQRLKLAKKELLEADKFDYSLVNKKLGNASRDLKKIVLSYIGK